MEKETIHNSEHGKTCNWCGLDRGFSWTRLILAILIGLFIFLAGIQIGTMRNNYGSERTMDHSNMRMNRYMNNDNDFQTRTIVIPAPSLQATPVTGPGPTVPAQQ